MKKTYEQKLQERDEAIIRYHCAKAELKAAIEVAWDAIKEIFEEVFRKCHISR